MITFEIKCSILHSEKYARIYLSEGYMTVEHYSFTANAVGRSFREAVERCTEQLWDVYEAFKERQESETKFESQEARRKGF